MDNLVHADWLADHKASSVRPEPIPCNYGVGDTFGSKADCTPGLHLSRYIVTSGNPIPSNGPCDR
jgi:hypothetical protein